jgi:hypothetical protein
MKKVFLLLILIDLLKYSVLSQNSIVSGIYVSQIQGMENTVYEFKNDTFITTSGDVIECCVIGETQKGLYSIKNDKIYFTPLPPKSFQKSEVKYDKEEYRYDRYDISIQVRAPENDTAFFFELYVYDSIDVDNPFITMYSSKQWLGFSYGGKQRIKKLKIISLCYENIELEFDPSFYGRHVYEINLAKKVHNYVYRSPYTWEIIEINPKYIRVRPDYSEYPMLMVKREYVTDDFIETGVFKEKME